MWGQEDKPGMVTKKIIKPQWLLDQEAKKKARSEAAKRGAETRKANAIKAAKEKAAEEAKAKKKAKAKRDREAQRAKNKKLAEKVINKPTLNAIQQRKKMLEEAMWD